MKKLLTVCVLGLFLVGGIIGCGGSPTSPSGTTTKEKMETKKVDGKEDTKKSTDTETKK